MHSDTPSTATLDCLRQLIGFDTTSRNSNLALIDWAGALLEGHGAKLRRAYNADRTKANLFATFGEGPGGVVLSGHTDVVPVHADGWRHDPFGGELIDGEVWGRGAVDMLNLTSSMAVAFRDLADDRGATRENARRFATREAAETFMCEHEWILFNGGMVVDLSRARGELATSIATIRKTRLSLQG